MKKIVIGAFMLGILLTGCQTKTENTSFSFGEDLVFQEKEDIFTIDLEQSSEMVKEKHRVLSEILHEEAILDDVVAVTTTTANLLEEVGIHLTGAPESPSLSKTLIAQQYILSTDTGIDKTKILNIGSAISPNIEAIVELNPKLVLYSDAMPKSDTIKSIESANIPAFPLGQSDYVDMFVLLDVLGNITGHKSEKINAVMKEMIHSLKEANTIISSETSKKHTVAILQVSEGSIVVNNDVTVLGRIAKALGMENVFASTENMEVNKEQLLTLDPDYIIYYSHGMGKDTIKNFEDELNSSESIYRELSAVKENKALQVASDEFVFSSSVDLNIVKIIHFLAAKFYE